VDLLKARLERTVEIITSLNGSRVANTVQIHIRHHEEPTGEYMEPDPVIAGNVYCKVCKQSLTAGRVNRHLSSIKHANAMRLR
jgi:hypothetical protein